MFISCKRRWWRDPRTTNVSTAHARRSPSAVWNIWHGAQEFGKKWKCTWSYTEKVEQCLASWVEIAIMPSKFNKKPCRGIIFGVLGKFILIIKWKDRYDPPVYRNETKLKSFHSKSLYYSAHMTFIRSTLCHAWVLMPLNLWGKNIWCTIHFIHKNKTYHKETIKHYL